MGVFGTLFHLYVCDVTQLQAQAMQTSPAVPETIILILSLSSILPSILGVRVQVQAGSLKNLETEQGTNTNAFHTPQSTNTCCMYRQARIIMIRIRQQHESALQLFTYVSRLAIKSSCLSSAVPLTRTGPA